MNDEDFQTYSDMLSELVQENIDSPNEEQIKTIRSLWDNESWESIVEKFQTEGSVWIVWWSDGVSAYIQTKADRG